MSSSSSFHQHHISERKRPHDISYGTHILAAPLQPLQSRCKNDVSLKYCTCCIRIKLSSNGLEPGNYYVQQPPRTQSPTHHTFRIPTLLAPRSHSRYSHVLSLSISYILTFSSKPSIRYPEPALPFSCLVGASLLSEARLKSQLHVRQRADLGNACQSVSLQHLSLLVSRTAFYQRLQPGSGEYAFADERRSRYPEPCWLAGRPTCGVVEMHIPVLVMEAASRLLI